MWQVYGQDPVIRQLDADLKSGHPAHAYLLVGPPHVGKMTLALNLAQAVNCLDAPGPPCGVCVQCIRIAQGHHADVRILALGPSEAEGPTRTVIGISDVRDVLRQINLKPFEGAHTVIIVDGAERMSEEAANAFLKSLEEPPPQVLFLLLTADEEALLPTIRSRCRRLLLRPLPKEQMIETLMKEHQADPQEAEKLFRLSRGCLGWAVTALAEDDGPLAWRETELDRLNATSESGLLARFNHANELASLFQRDREAAKETLYLWLRWWRDLLLIKEEGEDYVGNIDRISELRLQAAQLTTGQIITFTRRLLDTLEALDRNASARLALEVLMLELPQTPVQI